MIKEKAWPARAMYLLIAAALAISLLIVAAPHQKATAQDDMVDAEWQRVTTPTTDDFVLAPESTIVDFAFGDEGDVAYAIVYEDTAWHDDEEYGNPGYLLKSTDGAATWDNITKGIQKEVDDELGGADYFFVAVATDGEDAGFVAVALDVEGDLHVFISDDGGSTFVDTGRVEDTTAGSILLPYRVFAFAVSTEVEGERDIAIGGATNDPWALIFRCTVEGDTPGKWKDARFKGWDDSENGIYDGLIAPFSEAVVEIQFSPSYATDKRTVLVVTVDNYNTNSGEWGPPGSVYLQTGSWGATPAWNEKASYPEALVVLDGVANDVYIPPIDGKVAGIALPDDYKGTDSSKRILWVWVNYCTDNSPWFDDGDQEAQIFRVADDVVDDNGPQGQIHDGDYWLTNISYHGNIAGGEAIAGLIGKGVVNDDGDSDLSTSCCEGVQVYRNDNISNMIICCEPWDKACKPPTGRTAMEVAYVGDDKAYAVAVESGLHPSFFWLLADTDYDESAWSVTFDDGDTFNQLSLVDTNIDWFSDVAVSPDCNKTILVSINEDTGCFCDSVWLYADEIPEAGYNEYSGKWLRTWCGAFIGADDDGYQHGILRLAPEELEGSEVLHVYLADLGTDNVYFNDLETLGCWTLNAATVGDIADLAVKEAGTLFALDYNGDVAMFTNDEWQPEVVSEIAPAWTIAVSGDYILVGGQAGEVSYAEYHEGDEWEDVTFELLETIPTFEGYVTVAFDTYFDTNKVIYAAVAWATDPRDNGIYQWTLGESDDWKDLGAEPAEFQVLPESMWTTTDGDALVEVDFTGLVTDRPGNPFTDPENGGVIYASYEALHTYPVGNVTAEVYFTGAARSLERTVTVCTTCLDWDFLQVGLTLDLEGFWGYPDALKICGCLSPDTNSKIFAIDYENWYDMEEMKPGSVWMFEDCYGKKAPQITDPTDGDVIKADPCSCYSQPFTVLWDALCDACSYDIQFALDEDFEMTVQVNDQDDMTYHLEEQDVPAYSIMGGVLGGLSCETTYYIRVRAADAATGQIIHSWWSDPISITVAPSVEGGYSDLNLVSPVPGSTDQPTKNVGFSWSLQADADTFSWVLWKAGAEVDSQTGITGTYHEYTGTLDYSTTYSWQVTAYKDGTKVSESNVGSFTTDEKTQYCCPQCGLCFDSQAELEEHAQAHIGTPAWVWVVIGIGAALVIVVIVLIFRTRRV